MISFRHHVVSIVAVFLALAVGIVLGGGPLNEVGRTAEDTAQDESVAATTDSSSVRTEEFGNEFAAAVAPTLYADGLRDRAVAVLAMPGADAETISALSSQVAEAGAEVTGTFAVEDAMVDPDQKSLVDTLGSQLMTQLDDDRVDTGASTYVRMGQLLGLAVGTSEETAQPPDESTSTVRQSLDGAGLLASPADAQLAPLVLVVLPPGERGMPDEASTRAVLTGLMTGLDVNAVGVVAVGDADSAENGELAALRSVPRAAAISTVDGVEGELGQVSAVLALLAVLDGTSGAFGASGADGQVPVG
jgi:Copper transport outer membrane protein, MctB